MTNFSWPQVLSVLVGGHNLTQGQASWAMSEIMHGRASLAQMGAFMMALRTKRETVQELTGLVDVMLDNAVKLETGSDALDIVGTGGDLVGTVNISSMASIVAAAAGVPVLKHGSRSASGKTGSSEMLEELGIKLDLSPSQVAKVFAKEGITFFFAPVFHPAMRHVAPARKELGVPTTFNFLGPLANPAQPIATALGVADAEIAPLMAAELATRGRTALVFRSNDGLDELSTTSDNAIWQVSKGAIETFTFDAREIGIERVSVDALLGGDARHNAQIAKKLFSGEEFQNSKAISDIVCLNAAVGITAYDLAKDSKESETEINQRLSVAFSKAQTALTSGAALAKTKHWSFLTQTI